MVARRDGFVYFVRGALPGETVEAVVTQVRSAFARAEAVNVLVAHPNRVAPECPAFGAFGCGGCDFQHASGALQRQLKLDVLRDALIRQGRLSEESVRELTADGIVDLGAEHGWRTKMRFDLAADDRGGTVLGMHAHRADELVDASKCTIAHVAVLRAAIEEAPRHQPGDTVFAATGDLGARVWVGQSGAQGRRRDKPTVVHRGPVGVTEIEFHVPVDSFWQAHPSITDEIAQTVIEFGNPSLGATWWDLYSGVGPIAAVLADAVGGNGVAGAAHEAGCVHGVEGAAGAANEARRALQMFDNLRIHHADVRRWLTRPPDTRPEGVVLDPPRSGAGREVMRAVSASAPDVIVYVACDPVALGRDTAELSALGYQLTRLRAWDAFPQTHHLEAVAAFRPADQIS